MLTISEVILSAILLVGTPIPKHQATQNGSFALDVQGATGSSPSIVVAPKVPRIILDRQSFNQLARLIGHDID